MPSRFVLFHLPDPEDEECPTQVLGVADALNTALEYVTARSGWVPPSADDPNWTLDTEDNGMYWVEEAAVLEPGTRL